MENEFDKDELEVIRKMIEREKALSWFGSWFRNFLLVLAGGIVTLYTVYELFKR